MHCVFLNLCSFRFQHERTLLLQEAVWNLLIHRCNQNFPVAFKPFKTQEEIFFKSSKNIINCLNWRIKMNHLRDVKLFLLMLPSGSGSSLICFCLLSFHEVQLFTHKPLPTTCLKAAPLRSDVLTQSRLHTPGSNTI